MIHSLNNTPRRRKWVSLAAAAVVIVVSVAGSNLWHQGVVLAQRAPIELNVKNCVLDRGEGQYLNSTVKDPINIFDVVLPEIEFGQTGRVICEMGFSGDPSLGAQLTLSTELGGLITWEIFLNEQPLELTDPYHINQIIPIGQNLFGAENTLTVVVRGTAPIQHDKWWVTEKYPWKTETTTPLSDGSGQAPLTLEGPVFEHDIVPPRKFDLISLQLSTPPSFVEQHRAISVHPETVRIRKRIEGLRQDTTAPMIKVLKSLELSLNQGFIYFVDRSLDEITPLPPAPDDDGLINRLLYPAITFFGGAILTILFYLSKHYVEDKLQEQRREELVGNDGGVPPMQLN